MNHHIINKIKNLLALSKDNKNLNESAVAMAKAQELMHKHNLNEIIMEKLCFSKSIIIDSIRDKNRCLIKGNIEEWQACLANTISIKNNCRCYLTTIIENNQYIDAISVVGYSNDVDFIFVLFNWLQIELLRLQNELNHKNNDDFKESFLLGAIKKIGIRLQEEQEKINNNFRRTTKFSKNLTEFAITKIDNKIKTIDFYLKNLNLKNQNKEIKNQAAFGKGYIKADSVDLMIEKKIS